MIKAVIFDFGYTIVDPVGGELLAESLKTLEKLHKKGLKLAIVTKTRYIDLRLKQIKELGLEKYFDYVEAVPNDGIKEFNPIIENFKLSPEEFLVVGDRPKSEIKVGNKLGMKTCRFLYGPRINETADEPDEEPDYTIKNLSEVLNLV